MIIEKNDNALWTLKESQKIGGYLLVSSIVIGLLVVFLIIADIDVSIFAVDLIAWSKLHALRIPTIIVVTSWRLIVPMINKKLEHDCGGALPPDIVIKRPINNEDYRYVILHTLNEVIALSALFLLPLGIFNEFIQFIPR